MAALFKGGLSDLLRLLPTSTLIVYQMLNPIVTNVGACNAMDRVAKAVLLVVCAVICALSAFTDSFTGTDGKIRYGVVTTRGLKPFSGGDEVQDDPRYRLQPLTDFTHAVVSVIVFAAVALLADANTVACFYPAALQADHYLQKKIARLLPVLGAIASGIFTLLPSKRHGIGYKPHPQAPLDGAAGQQQDDPPQAPPDGAAGQQQEDPQAPPDGAAGQQQEDPQAPPDGAAGQQLELAVRPAGR